MTVYRKGWMVIFSGFFEPIFFLLGVGYGVGSMVGQVDTGGRTIPFAAFVAPGMLAASCMNGAITDGFFNVFFKLNFQGTYDGILATPMGVRDVALGEMLWAQFRGVLYAAGFLVVMAVLDLTQSWWALAALPAAFLVSLAFAAMAIAITSFASKIQHLDTVMGFIVMPLFLLSGTFFPISVYPVPLQIVVQLTPLYHGAQLLRGLTTGTIGPELALHIAYLVAMTLAGLFVAARHLEKRILK